MLKERDAIPMMQTRRSFLSSLSLLGAAGLIYTPQVLAADGALETTAIRFYKIDNVCVAPQYVAEELLRAEGFTEIRYIDTPPGGLAQAIGRGMVDFGFDYAPSFVAAIDAGEAITLLSGMMVGCAEVFANERVRSLADLKGKSVGMPDPDTTPYKLLMLMAAHVGLDPRKDIRWVTTGTADIVELFEKGKIDVFLGQPPESQALRARRVGHVIVNTAIDRPWSQYFCCLLGANRDYVRKYPVATKRALRAMLKAADLCATDREGAARRVVEGRFADSYDYALQTLNENAYNWRDYDPEDTLRFYSLRMHEVGFVKSSPQKIIANGTDWRFLNELRREMKA
jgi:NitT/TauT family transport system substrate-binding protein